MMNKSIVSQILAVDVPNLLFHYTSAVGLWELSSRGKSGRRKFNI